MQPLTLEHDTDAPVHEPPKEELARRAEGTQPRVAQHGVSSLLFASVFLLGAHSFYLLAYPEMSQVKLNLVLQLVLVASFGIWMWRKSGSYLSAPIILLAAIYVWHSPFLTGHLFGLPGLFEDTSNVLTVGGNFLPEATALIGLCLTMFALGVCGAYYVESRRARYDSASSDSSGATSILEALERKRDRALLPYAWCALVIYIVFVMAYFYFEGSKVFSQDYLESYIHASNSLLYRSYQATRFFPVIIILCLFALSRGRRLHVAAVFACILPLMFVQLMTGARSQPFIIGLAAFVAYDYFVRRHRSWLVATVAVASSAVSYTVAAGRTTGLGVEVFRTDNSMDLTHTIWEMGGTVGVVLRTMVLVRETGFEYGRSFLDAIEYVAPRKLVDGMGLGTNYVTPADWLVAHSSDVPLGGGLGYSVIAEAYLNFGMFGCVLFAIMGWFVSRWFFRFVFKKDRFDLLQSLCVAVVMALNMRNDAGAYVRVLIYGYLTIEVLRHLARVRSNPVGVS